jgi:hypothetical protein
VSLAPWLKARWPTPLLLLAPVILLAGAYAWLALEHDSWTLWRVIVHESGRYTLGQTVLFFRHFLREVPVDLAMGLFCAAAVGSAERAARRPFAGAAALLAIGLVLLAFVLAAGEEGSREALRDLLQYRTRDDEAVYGRHWNFHLLSTVWFGAAAYAVTGIWAGRGGLVRPAGSSRALHAAAWGWMGLLTVVFGVQADLVTSARYIGHQAREILTHGLITLPLTVAVLRWITGPRVPAASGAAAIGRSSRVMRAAVWGALVGIPIFLIVAFRGADFAATAQLQSSLAGVVAAHVFEHALDMVLVILVALAAAGTGSARTAKHAVQ